MGVFIGDTTKWCFPWSLAIYMDFLPPKKSDVRNRHEMSFHFLFCYSQNVDFASQKDRIHFLYSFNWIHYQNTGGGSFQ